MKHAASPLYDVERAARMARSARDLMEHCAALRDQQRSLLAAVRASLGHIQSTSSTGSSLLGALRAPGSRQARPEGPQPEPPPPGPAYAIQPPDLARYRLTEREREVAELLALGRSNDAVARALGISRHTARHHTESVFAKLGVRSRAEAGAVVRGWIRPAPPGRSA
ncbi:MAG TPA: helix-turn-helix transcriptional regulator [Gemmatimonadales bacterium]|nr:helix-turn-helix transcriptional regulator [Gemmatimonadales bacterium]